MEKYDYLIVGAGIFGAVFAREMTDAGCRVLVIDQRDHVAGNAFTKDVDGVAVHVYGPHIFHTADAAVWRYAQRFAAFNHYVHRVKVRHQEKVYSFPINLLTLQQLWGVCTPAQAQERLAKLRVPCPSPRNLEEWILAQVGEELYRTFVHGYTKKQWQREPRDLPASIIQRLPIRLTFDDNYFSHPFQGIPVRGYTAMVEAMLEGIRVELNTPLAKLGDWRRHARKLVYTGKLDEFFGYELGELEYRGLAFEHRTLQGDFQGAAQVNYTHEAVPYTRIVEHKHFVFGTQEKTVVTYEYASECRRDQTPFYPINDQRNSELCQRYKARAAALGDVIFGGRLAEYRYYDMDQVIGSALAASRRERGLGAG